MICQKLNVDYFDRYKKQEARKFNQIMYLKIVEQKSREKNFHYILVPEERTFYFMSLRF